MDQQSSINRDKLVQILIEKGSESFSKAFQRGDFTGNQEADDLVNDLKQFPHAFVLACLMDRQVKSERALLIPHYISQEIGGFEFEKLLRLDLSFIKTIFKKRNLHRFNDKMAEYFYSAIHLINDKYGGDASKIWSDSPKSASVVRRFLEFKGIGIKIATMAANILSREFKIQMQDRTYIDISPDVHVRRVFIRLDFISKDSSNDELIYCAREMNPTYPGVLDLSTYEIGRKWCRPTNPNCKECYLNKYCPKKI